MPSGEDRDRKLERAIGQRIRTLRMERGLSQSELAERISVTYQQVQKYERGESHFPVARLIHLAEALSVDVQALVGRGWTAVGEPHEQIGQHPPSPVLSDDEARVLRQYRSLRDPRLRRDLRHFLRLIVDAQNQPGS
jgi:transcriptional regulator with XRE-family HTH domain